MWALGWHDHFYKTFVCNAGSSDLGGVRVRLPQSILVNFRSLRGLLPPGGQNLQAPWCAASLPGLKAKDSNPK
jgi:hypothetical protein